MLGLPGLGSAKNVEGGEHRVRPGDTLSKIAQQYGVRVANLAAARSVRARVEAQLAAVAEGRAFLDDLLNWEFAEANFTA